MKHFNLCAIITLDPIPLRIFREKTDLVGNWNNIKFLMVSFFVFFRKFSLKIESKLASWPFRCARVIVLFVHIQKK